MLKRDRQDVSYEELRKKILVVNLKDLDYSSTGIITKTIEHENGVGEIELQYMDVEVLVFREIDDVEGSLFDSPEDLIYKYLLFSEDAQETVNDEMDAVYKILSRLFYRYSDFEGDVEITLRQLRKFCNEMEQQYLKKKKSDLHIIVDYISGENDVSAESLLTNFKSIEEKGGMENIKFQKRLKNLVIAYEKYCNEEITE